MKSDHRNHPHACPVCSRHDHSNTDPFGYDRDLQPVPAWWFTCPRCGTNESQVHVARWAPEGLAWMRTNPDFVGSYGQAS